MDIRHIQFHSALNTFPSALTIPPYSDLHSAHAFRFFEKCLGLSGQPKSLSISLGFDGFDLMIFVLSILHFKCGTCLSSKLCYIFSQKPPKTSPTSINLSVRMRAGFPTNISRCSNEINEKLKSKSKRHT